MTRLKMIQHALQPGSQAWHEHRSRTRNASDAAAMLGCDPNRSRNDLLHACYVGFSPDVSNFKQSIYDDGHRFEALARPLAEATIGDELYQIVGSIQWPGLPVPLGASSDGLTLGQDTNWEHKSLNDELRECMQPLDVHNMMVPEQVKARLPKRYRVQMEQQCMVTGCKRVLFTASLWEGEPGDEKLVEARHAWYYPDPALREEIVAGWLQFEQDLEAYVPIAHSVTPTANPIQSFPVLSIRVKGEVLESNLEPWRDAALAHIAKINRNLQTDQDFADAKATVKWCAESEQKLKLVKQQALEQMQSVQALFSTVDVVDGELTKLRLDLDKLVTAREKEIRGEIANEAADKLEKHLEALNERIGSGKNYMPSVDDPLIAADFAGAIKGKRTVKSLRDAVDMELARTKIAASAVADKLEKNLKHLKEAAADYGFLFADHRALIRKDFDDFALVVKARIDEHKAEEERKRVAAAEAEKRQMAMSEIQGIQQQVIIATSGRLGVRKGGTIECIRETLAETEAWVIDEASFGGLTVMAQGAKDKAIADIRQLLVNAEAKALVVEAPAPAPAPAVSTAAQPANEPAARMGGPVGVATSTASVRQLRPAVPPTLKIGDINARLGFTVTSDFLVLIGCPPAHKERSAVLYHEQDWDSILGALQRHLTKLVAQCGKAAA